MPWRKRKSKKFTQLEEAMGWELFMIHRPDVANLQNVSEYPRVPWVREYIHARSAVAHMKLQGMSIAFSVTKTQHKRVLKLATLDEKERSHTLYKEWEDDEGATMNDLESETGTNGILAFVDWSFKAWMQERYGN